MPRVRIPLNWILVLPVAAALFGVVRAADSTLEARVRQAVDRTYVHGMTDAIAQAEVGQQGIPVLLRLLFEPDLPRRDNVVAFLAHLDGEGITPRLRAFLDQSPGPLEQPEEERALLLVPLALARRAAGGDGEARGVLDRLVQPGLSAAQRPGPSSLASLLRSQAEVGLARMSDPAALRGAAPQEPSVAAAFDTNTRTHRTAWTVVNHVDAPNKVTSAQVDSIAARASDVAQTADFPDDVACCTIFVRGGTVGTFGTAGDGHDTIDSDTELQTVLNVSTGRVKVVRVINSCGGPGTNIIGCSYTPGFGMAVVRVSANEGILWLHEYGHNAGLDHVSQSNNVMYAFLASTAEGLNQGQCNTLHNPPSITQANRTDVGVCTTTDTCHDADGDGYGNPGSDLCPRGSATDCNDGNAGVNPGRRDLCNGVDNDCNGRVDDDAVCSTFDVNGDGRVSGAELTWIGRAFGSCSSSQAWWSKADYDLDGCVDGDDLAILSQAWNCTGSASICP
ncbi:MAG TPA: MopE-related protein [Candidatus Polarisedimenticolaceae bacterium]|nr:MopE-related protein [Candidatus Polarisedimenticolaceae bacterium]